MDSMYKIQLAQVYPTNHQLQKSMQ